MKKVYVTGIGIITAIGQNFDENLKSLRSSQTGIKKSHFFNSKYSDSYCFGEVPFSKSDLINISGNASTKGLTRTDSLALIAFDQAIKHAELKPQGISSHDTAFITASTVGGMCEHNELFIDAQLPETPSDYIYSYSFAAHALKIIELYNIKGFTNTINTACSSSANAIIMGTKLIQSNRVKRAIVGGADSLSKYTVNGFSSLKILSDNSCKPFDEERKGLSLGEGAAYLVLESEECAYDKKKYAIVSGYGNINDTFHQSSLSENASGVINAMTKAISKAGIPVEDIGYINTHGTATDNNDRVELLGISKIFSKIPPYNSTKSYTGHTLAASGAIEAVFSIMSLCNKELYKSLNCNIPIKTFNCPPIDSFIENIDIKHALSNSFGFGGNCTSLVLSIE